LAGFRSRWISCAHLDERSEGDFAGADPAALCAFAPSRWKIQSMSWLARQHRASAGDPNDLVMPGGSYHDRDVTIAG
jgi:hypothetical protein